MSSKDLEISEKIERRRFDNQLRRLRTIDGMDGIEATIEGKRLVNFCSNNYLGLANHPGLVRRSVAFTEDYGTGAAASRLVTGHFDYHAKVEDKLAKALGQESALLFNSGYQANLSILPALADRNAVIYADRACHHSLLQGAKLSGAKLQRYRHNDLIHLEELLKNGDEKARKIIVTETLFSMDGDYSDIDGLIRLSKHCDAWLYIDDAHAFGIDGARGFGCGESRKGIDFLVGGFGKAAGAFGGYVGCSSTMKEYLIQFAPGLIYSTAMPASVVGAIDAALDIIPTMAKERENLKQHAAFLRHQLKTEGFDTGLSASHIIPLILYNEQDALALAAQLEEEGILALAIRPPTVPRGSSRLRISLSALHTPEQIEHLIAAIKKYAKQR